MNAMQIPKKSSFVEPKSPHGQVCVSHLIENEGFTCEEHSVETADGYILSLLHIVKCDEDNNDDDSAPLKRGRDVVLLQHGLFQTSLPFVFNEERSLAFHLLRQGCDVWLCNSRGNLYSRGHVKYNVHRDPEFWDFSIDDLPHDMAANIEYVCGATGVESVVYIGHSQGAALAFAGFATSEQLQNRVRLFVAMSPGGFVQYADSNLALRGLVYMHNRYPRVFSFLFGRRSFLPLMENMRDLIGIFVFQYLSYAMFAYLLDQYDTHWNASRKHWYFSESPGGASSRCVEHWCQLLDSRQFQKYDYGTKHLNRSHYGRERPPPYNLRQIRVPTAVIWGGKDVLVNVQRLVEELPNVVYQSCIEHHGHIDNLNAVDTPNLVYEPIVQLIRTVGQS